MATAANMQFAMKELIDAFEEEKGIKADMILSSSGKLTAQIEAGAPFDLFFSADTKYPEQLASKGLSDAPIVYAFGQLVEWQKRDSEMNSFALANPKTAPYGKATIEYLKASQRELTNVVYGESISQVNQFLISGSVEAGFTSLSSMNSKKLASKGYWRIIPDSLHSPISQAVVILTKSERAQQAQDFMDFVQSAQGQEILARFGYK